ncbi:MAG: T9SS type A sorting domain-containing protein [Saprospiraceae bacterium]
MKLKYYLIVALAISFSFIALGQKTVTGTITSDNVKRSYRLYIPKSYTGTSAVPLLFNFHGYTSNALQQEFYGSFKAIADTANFLVLLPEGLPLIGTNTGFNNFSLPGVKPDDVLFTSNLIDSISATYNVDKNRIYSTGMSNGGFMSYDLACFLSERIAAIASVAGSMVQLHLSTCQAKHPTPVMQIHGTTDQVIPYNGVGILVTSVHIDTLINHWVKFNKCNAIPSKTNIPNANTADNCTAERYVYENGTNGSTVEFYKIIGGGHTWPGSLISTGSGNTNKDFNASLAIWQFLSRYRLNQVTAAKNTVADNTDFSIFPNPSNGFFTLKSDTESEASLLIFNSIGELLLNKDIKAAYLDFSLENAPKGLYFYQIKGKNTLLKSGKLVID